MNNLEDVLWRLICRFYREYVMSMNDRIELKMKAYAAFTDEFYVTSKHTFEETDRGLIMKTPQIVTNTADTETKQWKVYNISVRTHYYNALRFDVIDCADYTFEVTYHNEDKSFVVR